MLAFLLSPAARYLALATAIVGFVVTVYLKGHSDGEVSTVSRINKENADARKAAENGRADVDACYALHPEWVWDIRTGKCIRGKGNPGR